MTAMKAAATATVNTISILLIECDPDPQRRLSPSSDSGDGNAVELASGHSEACAKGFTSYLGVRIATAAPIDTSWATQSMICRAMLERNSRGCGLRG